tara:strand:+ start:19640 stop:20734 length:1095 start_codon:yes stop_codon:yes gene_type:complete
MKVLHVLNGFKNGGIESLAIQLIKHAPITVENCLLNANRREQGMSTFFRNLKSNNYLSKILEWEECDGIVLFVKTFLLCLKIRPDSILIYPFNRPMLLVAFAARLAGVKRIAITVQNTAPKSLSSQRKWATLLFWFNRLKILVVPCTKAIINSIQPYSARTVLSEVIHNGCDTQDISSRANITRRKRTPNDSLRVIMVSRLDTIKDQTTLIKAFNRVKQANWKLQLVGEGSKRKELESLAIDLGLNIEETFLGKRFDIPELLGQADIFAFSTTPAEGFGIVLIEAMAAGLPIIASDVPACREVLDEGKAGKLLPYGDIESWSRELHQLLLSPTKRNQLAQKSIKYAAKYDIQETASNWYQLLKP